MRIRLTFASEDELMRRCHLAIRLGVLFFPSSRIPEPGSECNVEWHIRDQGLVLEAQGLVAGPSVIDEEGKLRRGLWVRIVSLSHKGPTLEAWLESIGAASHAQAAIEVPQAPKRAQVAHPVAQERPAPSRPPVAPPAHAPQLPDPAREDDLGWLSGNIRQSEP